MSDNNEFVGKKWAASFFTIWTGQAFSLLGSQLVQFALIWWLTVKTGSATVLATASLVGMLPQVFLGPITGVLIDRWNRRWIMIIADSFIALATLVLAVLFATGTVQVWHVFAILFVRSVAGGFHYPAMAASTSLMVPSSQLTRIQGINQTLSGALNIVAAPLGALLLDILPIEGVLAIDIVTAMLAIAPLLFIHVPQPVRSTRPAGEAAKPSIWGEMKEGFLYMWSWPGLFSLLLMATMINLVVSPAFSLMPLLVKEHFSGGAINLAAVESATGFGILAGGILLGAWGGFKRKILTSLSGLFILGFSMVLIGSTPAWLFYAAVAGAFLTGTALSLANGPLHAILQSVVAPDMQGRVFTLVGSVATAMTPLGLAVAGPVSDAVGVQAWFVAGGIVTLLMAAAGLLAPSVYHIEDNHRKAIPVEVPVVEVVSSKDIQP